MSRENRLVSGYCPHCTRFTAFSIERCHKCGSFELGVDTESCYKKKWRIGVCNYCHNPIIIIDEGMNKQYILPHLLPSASDEKIPEKVRGDLDEAKLCYSVNACRACAAMARRAIQMTCLDKGASKGDLIDQIKELLDKGIITNDIKNWADTVRWIGNDAVHPTPNEVTIDDAEDVLHLAEQFLHIIYVTPTIAEEQRKKRGK